MVIIVSTSEKTVAVPMAATAVCATVRAARIPAHLSHFFVLMLIFIYILHIRYIIVHILPNFFQHLVKLFILSISFYENIFRSVLFFAIMRPDYNFSHRESPPLYLYAVRIVHVPFCGKKSPFALSGAK